MAALRRSRRNLGLAPDESEDNAVQQQAAHGGPVLAGQIPVPPIPAPAPDQEEQKQTHVPTNQIPDNIPEGGYGYDTTGQKLIRSDGRIIYDQYLLYSDLISDRQRNKKYHDHKKYLINQVCLSCA